MDIRKSTRWIKASKLLAFLTVGITFMDITSMEGILTALDRIQNSINNCNVSANNSIY